MEKTTLNLVTWNVGMLVIKRLSYVIVEPAAYKHMRFRYLPEALNACPANIIALQELYHPEDVAHVIDKTRERFPYYAIAECPKSSSRLNPGLVVLSDRPIIRSEFHAFDILPPDEAAFVRKGMLHCTVDAGPFGTIELVNTHNTSGGMLWSPHNILMHQVRRSQYRQMFRLLRKFPQSRRIAVGDFNAGPEISDQSYRGLIQPDFRDAWVVRHGSDVSTRKATWDPANSLNREGPHRSQKGAESLDGFHLDTNLLNAANVDHVNILFEEPVVRGPIDRLLTISDHYGVEMSLSLK